MHLHRIEDIEALKTTVDDTAPCGGVAAYEVGDLLGEVCGAHSSPSLHFSILNHVPLLQFHIMNSPVSFNLSNIHPLRVPMDGCMQP